MLRRNQVGGQQNQFIIFGDTEHNGSLVFDFEDMPVSSALFSGACPLLCLKYGQDAQSRTAASFDGISGLTRMIFHIQR
jgi:hypothetical protein